MERELNKGGKTDEKIQSIDGNAARGNRSVGRGGGAERHLRLHSRRHRRNQIGRKSRLTMILTEPACL